jgi:Ala-tRNA(Pro) deacylase
VGLANPRPAAGGAVRDCLSPLSPGSESVMTMTSDELLTYLKEIGIGAITHEHSPVHTIDDSKRLRGDIPGIHTKNLFLRDTKKQCYLVVTHEETTVNLKNLRHKLHAKGTLSFGRPETLMEHLGVTPGAVSLLALINDRGRNVALAIEDSLLLSDPVNCHPLTNNRTTSLSANGILLFLERTGHLPLSISFDGESDAAPR